MPRPTSATTLQRPDLGAIAYEYLLNASQRGFIGTSILPVFGVQEQSGDYPKIPIESLLKMPDVKRSARGNYNRSDYNFETGNYACEEYGWEEPVDDSEANLYRRYFDAEEVAIMRAVDILLRAHEQRVATAVFNTGNITNTAAVTTEWSTAASATPRSDVLGGKEALRVATGLVPDRIAMSAKVFNNLMLTSEVTTAFQYTNPIQIGDMEAQKRVMAQYLGMKEVVVGDAIKDGAKKGQSYSISDIWDDEYVLLYRKLEGADLRSPVLGVTFLWESDSPNIVTTEQYREEQTRSNVYRVRHNTDEAFIFTGAGYLLSNITA